MHIVLGVLSAVGGVIWALVALQRSGFNPASLNPFLWYRRHQWRKKYGTHPLFSLDDPMDVAAVLVLGTAKCEGVISSGQKQAILDIFQSEFRLDANAAADLLLASSHLIRDEIYLVDNLQKLLARSSGRFTGDQAASLLSMMQQVARHDSPVNDEQHKLIVATGNYFERLFAGKPQWKPGGSS